MFTLKKASGRAVLRDAQALRRDRLIGQALHIDAGAA